MPKSPRSRPAARAAVAALGASGLIALAAAPAAFGQEAPELVVGGIGPVDGLKPGSSFELPVTVANKGSVAAEDVWVAYTVTRGLDYAEVPSNCAVQHIRPYDEMPERWRAVCSYDQVVEPGVVYTPEKPLRVTALDRALYDEVGVRVQRGTFGADENGDTPVQGTAPAVDLVEAPAGGEGAARYLFASVTTDNTADYQVTGAALKGSVGDTVTMKAKFTNAGPAWVRYREGDRSANVRIKIPAGMSVVKHAYYCHADGDTYSCGIRPFNEGGGETYTFELKIDKRVPDAKGYVALSTEPRPFDPEKSNDKADITLEVTGGDTTGSTGGSGGSGTSGGTGGSSAGSTGGSSGSAGGSTGGSTGSTGSTGSGTSGSVGGNGSTTSGGNLAATGSSALPLAGVAAAAVVAGAGAVVIVRRRRAQRLG
ncbi:hypothetical protein [Streptomyces sp. NPDC000983]|uniref:hypothetical protein n=1 Tax=Streptomyces sp. NPDC000983 TaxID=3154373 RepID=UPI0033243D72